VGQVFVAGAAMGGVLWFGAADLGAWLGQDTGLRAARLVGWIGLGVGVYFAALLALGWRPSELLKGVDRD
jgi:peptidoglycan biosynthesis protein MviN/MurJ (putative lipid II flippase)